MRNLLALAALVVLVLVGLGWYLGWYQVQRTSAQDGHHSFNVDVNAKKIKEDVRTGEDKIHKAIEGMSNDSSKKSEGTSQRASDAAMRLPEPGQTPNR